MTGKRKIGRIFGFAIILLLTLSPARGEEGATITIHRARKPERPLKALVAFCTEIRNKECVDPSTSFPVSAGKVYCHTTVTGAKSYMEIQHQWIHNGKVIQTIRLPVRYSRFRTWSVKTLEKRFAGHWNVRVYAGDILIAEGSFEITQ